MYWFIQLGLSGDVTKGPKKGLKNISKFLKKNIFFLFASQMLKLYSLFKCYTISETTWHIFYTDEGKNGILPLTNEKWHIVNDFFIQNFLVHRGFKIFFCKNVKLGQNQSGFQNKNCGMGPVGHFL